MTETNLNHPTDETLRALSLGQLAEAELADVSSHLGDCPECCRRIDQLAADDPLLARLQQAAAGHEEELVSPAQRRPAVRALRQAHEAGSDTDKKEPQAMLPKLEEFVRRYLGVVRGSHEGGPPAGLDKPTAPRSSLGDMTPLRLREGNGENEQVVRPNANARPLKSEPGDRYQLFGEIARGGMGAVFRGHDVHLRRDLAVKVLLERHANQPEGARRFVEEAQIGGQLQHPGVVPVYDIGRFGDRLFFTMKLVEGKTLAAILKERAQPIDERPRLLNIALKVSETLAYAHAKGVIHRDLKPANIMVGEFGEVQVMDWGLAKVLTDDGGGGEKASRERERPEGGAQIRTARSSGSTGSFGSETEAGLIMGTPAYMPPEQANGDIASLDRRADVFGLGAILCEVLTGEPPYVGFPSEVPGKAALGDLADAHARLDGCGADRTLIDLTKSCLSRAANDRPADAQAVADGLSKYMNSVQERLQATERERAVAVVRASEEGKRRRVQLALTAALVLLLVGGGAFAFWRIEQAQVSRERDARNAEAVAALLSQCEESLRANDAAKAAVTLEAAKKRSAEGGAEEQAERIRRLDADLALVRDLDAVDQFRWTVVENLFPDMAAVATRTQAAVRRFGVDPDAVSVEEAAARVSASMARARVVAALDRLLWHEKSANVRALLSRVDADPNRDAIRDAILAGNSAKFVELAAQRAAPEQPPGFVAFLCDFEEIPVERRRRLLQAAVSQRPEDLGLLMTLGRTYPIDKEVADARRCWFQAAVAAAPANASAHNSLGIALSDKGQLDDAIACYKKALDLDPEYSAALNNLGAALNGKGQAEAAAACYKKAIEIDPKLAMAHANLGSILCDVKRDYEGAIACFQKALDLDPNFGRAHNGMGVVRRAQGQVDQAMACFQKAIDLDPKLASAHVNLGAILRDDKRDYEGAIACFQKAIEIDPKLANAHFGLGIALASKGQVDQAIVCYQKAVNLEPKNVMSLTFLGVALAGKGEVDGAIVCFRNTLDLDSENVTALLNLGAILCDVKHDFEGAIACYQKAIDVDPNLARAHNGLGVALASKGQVDAAIPCYRKAIDLEPNFPSAHNSLGAALYSKGQVDQAIDCYRKAIDLDPNYANAHNGLGVALTSKGQVDAAIACYQRAIALDPKNAMAHTNLGVALAGKCQVDEAIACFQKAIAIKPNYARAQAQLANAQQLAALRDKLAAYQNGTYTPAAPAEYLDMAKWCRVKKFHYTASGLYAAAFAAAPMLADDLRSAHRYNAARHAALAAAGQGDDAVKLDDKERTRMRQQALAWLRADLALWAKQLEADQPADRIVLHSLLRHWLEERDLAGLRDATALARLPAEEQQACTQLWADVAALLKKAEEKPN